MDATRRDVLTGIAGGALPLQGLPTLGGLDLSAVREDDLDGLFDNLDHHIAAFQDAAMPPEVVAYFGERDLPGDTFHTMFAGLLTTSLVRDLPENLQKLPRVQDRLWRQLADIGRAAFSLRSLFQQTTDEQRRQLGERVSTDPGFMDRFWQNAEPWFGPGGIESARKGQLREALDRLCWDLSNGDPVTVFDDQIKQIDRFERMAERLERRHGGVPGMFPEAEVALDLEVEGSSPACAETVGELIAGPGEGVKGSAYRAWLRETHHKAKIDCREPGGGFDPIYQPHRLQYAARKFAIVGGMLTGLGIVTLPLIIGMCILTPALLCLLIALVLYTASQS